MPHLIAALLLLWLSYVALKFLAQVAMWAALPVATGWLVFVAVRTWLRHQTVGSAQPLWAELLTLAPGNTLVFCAHASPEVLLPARTGALSDARWAAVGVAGCVLYALHTDGRFVQVAQGTVVSPNVVAGMALLLVGAGLWAALGGAERDQLQHNMFVNTWLARRVKRLNALGGNAQRFQAEAASNTRLRATLGGMPDAASQRLMQAIQAQWAKVVAAPQALQQVLDQHTQQTIAENAVLHTLCQRHAAVLHTYDQACAEANAVGNEAVFRYLDMVWRALQSLEQLVAQDQWEALAQHLDGAADELQQLRNNIHHIGQDDAAAHSGEEADAPGPDSGADGTANPYAVLGVKPDLSPQQLKDVYRKLAQIYHPDKGLVSDPARFQAIQQAWQAIAAERGL